MSLTLSSVTVSDPISITIEVFVGAWRDFKIAVQDVFAPYAAETCPSDHGTDDGIYVQIPTLRRYQDLMAEKHLHKKLAVSALVGVGTAALLCAILHSWFSEVALAASLTGFFGVSMYLRARDA